MDSDSVRSLSRRVAIGVLFLAAACTLSALIAKRATNLRNSTVIQRLGVLVLGSALIHIALSCLILFALGAGMSASTCSAAGIIGLVSYLCTKLLVFAYLLERVYVVWHLRLIPRRKSATYRLAALPFLAICAVFGYVIATRHNELRPYASPGSRSRFSCHLGVDNTVAAPLLLATSCAFSALLLALFLIPLLKAQFTRARTIARKSCLASAASLCSEAVVLGVLLWKGGWERSFVWLGSCGADVLLNAIIIYSITSSSHSTSSFDLEASLPPPTPYPDFASPRSQFSKSSFGSPRPSMSRAHSLDHFSFAQAAPSPPKVAFLLNRPLRGLSEDLVVEFDGEDGDEGKTSSGSPSSMAFLDSLHSNYTPSPSSSSSPPSYPPPQSPKGSTLGI
ncbi:hypothetical protein BCR35DRAFT_352902 [Leucosporidium creatinivorum]|uniref:G-protein coupled receptors family 3 profile domain-containing protein n=1 Tax=Leucosporidium creatinivorum TaxID=106004 RepID=A0A1Y2F3A7_9BASI|nr:hypothetical protein BCR35DRAFT_352902 [Leucosporidium creatinivorum]